MSPWRMVMLSTLCALSGCGIEEAIRKNDDWYATPGAQDSPLTGIYSKYSFKLMGRYQVSHEWVNTAACSYRARELPNLPSGKRSNTYLVPEIYEADGKTWQASNAGLKPMDFDPWVRSVKWTSKEKGKEGEVLEVGFKPLCFESWWTSSHYLRLRIQKRSLAEFERVFSERYPEGKWHSESINSLQWRVQQVPVAELRTRPLNGLGGPYKAWLTALGNSGYSISIEMGASQESLDQPRAHAEIEAVFKHLVGSLKVERLTP